MQQVQCVAVRCVLAIWGETPGKAQISLLQGKPWFVIDQGGRTRFGPTEACLCKLDGGGEGVESEVVQGIWSEFGRGRRERGLVDNCLCQSVGRKCVRLTFGSNLMASGPLVGIVRAGVASAGCWLLATATTLPSCYCGCLIAAWVFLIASAVQMGAATESFEFLARPPRVRGCVVSALKWKGV